MNYGFIKLLMYRDIYFGESVFQIVRYYRDDLRTEEKIVLDQRFAEVIFELGKEIADQKVCGRIQIVIKKEHHPQLHLMRWKFFNTRFKNKTIVNQIIKNIRRGLL